MGFNSYHIESGILIFNVNAFHDYEICYYDFKIKLNIFEQESEVIIQIKTFISLEINHFIKSNYSNPSNKN